MTLPTYWIGVGAALGLGAIGGFISGRLSVEGKVRAEYAQSVEMLKNAFEQNADKGVEAPQRAPEVDTVPVPGEAGGLKARLSELKLDHEPKPFVEKILVGDGVIGEAVISPEVVTLHEPDYAKAIAAQETSVDTFVSGGINDYGISYIEDFEYEEDDGRPKWRIDIMMDEHNPIFIMEGQKIDDWDKRLGDSILVDFYTRVPPGVDPVLYVRNHQAGEDYEVVLVTQV